MALTSTRAADARRGVPVVAGGLVGPSGPGPDREHDHHDDRGDGSDEERILDRACTFVASKQGADACVHSSVHSFAPWFAAVLAGVPSVSSCNRCGNRLTCSKLISRSARGRGVRVVPIADRPATRQAWTGRTRRSGPSTSLSARQVICQVQAPVPPRGWHGVAGGAERGLDLRAESEDDPLMTAAIAATSRPYSTAEAPSSRRSVVRMRVIMPCPSRGVRVPRLPGRWPRKGERGTGGSPDHPSMGRRLLRRSTDRLHRSGRATTDRDREGRECRFRWCSSAQAWLVALEQAEPHRGHDRLGPVGGAELLVELGDVGLGGRLADVELLARSRRPRGRRRAGRAPPSRAGDSCGPVGVSRRFIASARSLAVNARGETAACRAAATHVVGWGVLRARTPTRRPRARRTAARRRRTSSARRCRGRRVGLRAPCGRVEPAAVGQPDVDHDHVGGSVPASLRNASATRAGLADHLEVAGALEGAPQPLPDQLVVVDEQDVITMVIPSGRSAPRRRGCALPRRSLSVTLVPGRAWRGTDPAGNGDRWGRAAPAARCRSGRRPWRSLRPP